MARQSCAPGTRYACADKNAEPLDSGTGRARRGDETVDEVMALCAAPALLARQRWVTENGTGPVAVAADGPEGYDSLRRLKASLPHLSPP